MDKVYLSSKVYDTLEWLKDRYAESDHDYVLLSKIDTNKIIRLLEMVEKELDYE